MRYLTKTVETYRVATVEQAQAFHEELKNDNRFTVSSFTTKTKYIKEKKEIVEEYQLVTVTKLFNDEKEPDSEINVNYDKGAYFNAPKREIEEEILEEDINE